MRLKAASRVVGKGGVEYFGSTMWSDSEGPDTFKLSRELLLSSRSAEKKERRKTVGDLSNGRAIMEFGRCGGWKAGRNTSTPVETCVLTGSDSHGVIRKHKTGSTVEDDASCRLGATKRRLNVLAAGGAGSGGRRKLFIAPL